MALVVYQSGALKLSVKHVIRWKDGVLYFNRRVPEDLQRHYNGKNRIRRSLKTTDPKVAAKEAARLAAEQDALWRSLRSPEAHRNGLTSPDVRAAGAALLDAMGLQPGEAHVGCDYTRDETREQFDGKMARRVGPEYSQVRYNPDLSPEQINQQLDELLTPVQKEAQRLFYGGKRKLLLSDALKDYLGLKGLAAASKASKDASRSIRKVTDTNGPHV